MRIDIMTLFPESIEAVLGTSIIGRARARGAVEINCVQIRDYTENRQMQVDDYPYGGGRGCVMTAQPLKSCLDAIIESSPQGARRVIYLSPQGAPFTQEKAKSLAADYAQLILVCGHYEGIDERFINSCVDEELSLGDFVLTGGEIAAMAVADSVCRLVPGVLSDEECYTDESHWNGLLEYPQYTRPEIWEGQSVPEALLTGDHARIAEWRHLMSLRRTLEKRPDMLRRYEQSASEGELEMIARVKRQAENPALTAAPTYRRAQASDIPEIMQIVDFARRSLKDLGADQWQGEYPTAEIFRGDIARGECYTVDCAGQTAGFFTLAGGEEPCYAEITDGKWRSDGPYCTLHRAAVGEAFRGSGLGLKIFAFAEEISKNLGAKALRTDTHRKNEPMKRILNTLGYRYRGNVLVQSEPGHDARRLAFEKVFK